MPRTVVVIETDENLLKELLDYKQQSECKVPEYSFAAKVFQFLSGIAPWPRIPAPPPLPVEAPDIEP